MSQTSTKVACAKNGSIVAVERSGFKHMSDSFIAFHPAMDEPSNMNPSTKDSSSIVDTAWVKCCHFPRGSVNRRSTNRISFSLIICRTELTSDIIFLSYVRLYSLTGPRGLSLRF